MNKRLLWIIEFIIWGLIIFSTLFVSLYVYNKNVREKHTYYVFFKDVDGLIKGSPVKIQGYQVGYVSDIAIVNDDVFITFIINDNELRIPDNIIETIAFTGMGGSKSLELSVPDKNTKVKNYITTVEPRRLQEFYVYQTQIAQNILTMTTSFMEMFDDRTTRLLKDFIRNPVMLHEARHTLDKVESSENTIINKWRNNENRLDK